jgi:hypothetical protein
LSIAGDDVASNSRRRAVEFFSSLWSRWDGLFSEAGFLPLVQARSYNGDLPGYVTRRFGNCRGALADPTLLGILDADADHCWPTELDSRLSARRSNGLRAEYSRGFRVVVLALSRPLPSDRVFRVRVSVGRGLQRHCCRESPRLDGAALRDRCRDMHFLHARRSAIPSIGAKAGNQTFAQPRDGRSADQ